MCYPYHSRRFVLVFLSTLSWFTAIGFCWAANTWHVSETGQASRNGSLTAPWSVADFNTLSNWSGTPQTPGRISPGDTVLVLGTISSEMRIRGNGTAEFPIVIQFDKAARLSGRFNFLGRDHIHLKDFVVPDGVQIPAALIVMGSSSGNISRNSVIEGGYSLNKTGSSVIHASYSDNLTIRNNRFLQMTGNGITGDAFLSGLNVLNNELTTTTNATDVTSDLVKLGWATDVTIQGNKFILQASKMGGDPHNDILQNWYNYSNRDQRPRDWRILHNWFEIRKASGGAFNNFTMFQYMAGEFHFYGNLFYSHGLSSQIGNGVNLSRHGSAADPLHIIFENNTFVSVNNGLLNQITSSSQSESAASNSLTLVNNIFYTDALSGETVRESISTMQGGVLVADNNLFYGWMNAIGHLDPVTGVRVDATAVSETWGPVGRTLSDPEAEDLFTSLESEIFEITPTSAATSAGRPLEGGGRYLPASVRSQVFPNPTVISQSLWHIGAHMPVSHRPSPITIHP